VDAGRHALSAPDAVAAGIIERIAAAWQRGRMYPKELI
jgi:hypothetical protein